MCRDMQAEHWLTLGGEYDATSIAEDILRAAGCHPRLRALNAARGVVCDDEHCEGCYEGFCKPFEVKAIECVRGYGGKRNEM